MSFKQERKKVINDLKKVGLSKTIRPKNLKSLSLPEDITKISDRQLGQYLGWLTSACNYAHWILAMAIFKKNYNEHKLRVIKARLIHTLPSKDKKYEKDSKITINPDVLKTDKIFRIVSAEVDLLESMFLKFDREMNTISREITRREKLMFGDKRKVK